MSKKYNGGVPLPTSVKVESAQPSDDRLIVTNKASLATLEYAYPLMKVIVESDGNTYQWVGGVQTDLNNWVDEVTLLQDAVDNIEATQITGIATYTNLADLPGTGVAQTSYRVTNDSVSSNNNGYYTWNGSSYVKDASLYDTTPTENSTNAVESQGVFDALATKISALRLQNDVIDGNFPNDVNWGKTNLNVVDVTDNVLTFLTTAATGILSSQNIFITNSDIIYYSVELKATSNLVEIDISGTNPKPHSGSGNFERITNRVEWTFSTANWNLRVEDRRTSLWDNVSVKNALFLNLTEIYGAGNEPTTEEIELILANYENNWFDAEVFFPSSEKVRNDALLISPIDQDINLLDSTTFTDGKFLNELGVEFDNVNMKYSDFIEVRPGFNYVTPFNALSNLRGGCYFDKDKNFLENIDTVLSQANTVVTVPEYAYYAKVNVFKNAVGLQFFGEEAKFNKDSLSWLYNKALIAPTPPIIRIDDINENTFIGAYNKVFGLLYTAKIDARVIMISHYSEDAFNRSYFYRQLIEQQKAISEYWGVPLCLLSEKSGWINKNGYNLINNFASDGIHPDPASFPLLAEIVTPFLKSFIEDGTGKKIAWYGTSIPNRANSYADLSSADIGAVLNKQCTDSGTIRRYKYDGVTTVESDGFRSFFDLTEPNNYQVSMLDLIGTIDEPDYFVFDYGVNDFFVDNTDFNLFDKNKQL